MSDDLRRLFCESKTYTHKAEDGTTRTRTDLVASTATVDRVGDIVEQDWKLEAFLRNPVALFNHNPDGGVVGRVVRVVPDTDALEATIEWDEAEDNPLGKRIARQYRERFLNAFSVGFRAGSMIPRSSLDEEDPRHGTRGFVLSANELLEISAVPIPANPEALAARAFAMPEDDLDERVTAAVRKALREDPETRAILEAFALTKSEAPRTSLDGLFDDRSSDGTLDDFFA